MIRLVKCAKIGFKVLTWTRGQKFIASSIQEDVEGEGRGSFRVYLPSYTFVREFERRIGHGFASYESYSPDPVIDPVSVLEGKFVMTSLFQVKTYYYTKETEREEFLRRLRRQNFFLEYVQKGKCLKLKRYDKTSEISGG